ncbi:MAG: glycosyltransferase family 1 protein [Opitutaceae bacterium]
MNLVYDGRIFQIQRAGGINRYFAEVIGGLPADWRPMLLCSGELGSHAPRHPNLQVRGEWNFHPRRWRPLVNRQINFRSILAQADILHPTYYSLSECLTEIKCPLVTTVYDFTYAAYSSLMNDSASVIRDQTQMIERADHVICISKFTENDLLERVPAARGKTSVIYLSASFASDGQNSIPEDPPAFLFVGARYGYKNFAFLLRAFAAACSQRKNLRLYVAGPPLTPEERWQAHFLGITDRLVSVVYPDEAELKRLYQKSLALLYPSIHEGFGIPPLEAMACRTVAVTANNTCLPEVVADGGIMLDPFSESDWTECMLQLVVGRMDRAAVIKRGLARVGLFSWEKSTRLHNELYRRIAGK